MQLLEKLIQTQKARVAVIGLGYVGLPTAVELAKNGYEVFGIDIRKEKVDNVNQGISYVSNVPSELIKQVVDTKLLRATADFQTLQEVHIILICVPTPLDKNKIPDVSHITSTVEQIAAHLQKGQLIILESSTYPGTTREIILPLLERNGASAGKDFLLAYSPERIDPGNEKYQFKDIPRVVGGITEECSRIAVAFYRSFLAGTVMPMSSPEAAEMTKILENTFRLINISMINELALLCGKMGIDIWEVIEAAKTKPYGFMAFYPSPKIGGHCIPLDPFYLSWKAREYNFWTRFIELAGEINEQMPHYVVARVIWALNLCGKPVRDSRIFVWGVAYKRDIGDWRESAALDIIPDLMRKGAKVEYFDPLIPRLELTRNHLLKESLTVESVPFVLDTIGAYDLVLILVNHTGFDYEAIAERAQFVVDTRNAIKSRAHANVSWL